MKEINIKKLQDAGFKQFDSEYIGKVNNYFFSIKDNQASEDLLYVTISIAPSESKNILFKYLDDLQKDNKIDENKAFLAALLHDCAKDIRKDIEEELMSKYFLNYKNEKFATL